MSDLVTERWVPERDGTINAISPAPTEPGRGRPGSDEWWLSRLMKKFAAEAPNLKLLDDYYDGQHRLAFASRKFRETFGGLFNAFADNWCDLVVDATEERLNIEGFRWGEATESDQDAWQVWQENELDAESQIGHTEAMIHGRAFAMVQPPADGDQPLITVESARQMVVEYRAGGRRGVVAALKKWEGEDGRIHIMLVLPDRVVRWQTRRAASEYMYDFGLQEFEPRTLEGEDGPVVANPLGYVPVVPLPNKPRLLKVGTSEIARIIPVQNAANKFLADMIIAAEYGAIPQRHLTGYEAERNPETGEKITPVKIEDRLWMVKKGEFGEFSETNLQNYVAAIELCVQHIASQTRTPPHYFFLRGQFPSGESIKSAETGLVAKVRRKQRHFGEAWERVMRMAFAVMGEDAKALEAKVETVWGDPEYRSESAHIDALVKMKDLGVHPKILWEKAGLSQVEIRRNEELFAAEPESDEDSEVDRPAIAAV